MINILHHYVILIWVWLVIGFNSDIQNKSILLREF